VGGGASVRVHRLLTFDLSVFPRGEGGESRAVVATAGTALYSAYLGYGQRKYFNPYVGARAGYGYFDGTGGVAVAAELGIELFKHEYLLVDTAIRALAFVREEGNQAAIQGTLGVAVPF
jgi:opacity protein-like surface antigen